MSKKSLFALLISVLTLSSCVEPHPSTSIQESVTPSQSTTQKESSTPKQDSSVKESESSEPSEVYVETPTIFLAGDSTVKTYNDNQYIAGWGQYLDLFLKDEIEVVNCANGGRSSRSFINEGRLFNIDDSSYSYNFSQNDGKSIEDCITEGDYLFIQFGHNDDNTKMASSYTTIFDRMVPLGTPDANGIYPTTAGVKSSTSSLPKTYTDLASDSEESKALAEIAKYGSEYYAYDSGGTYKWYLKQYIDFARSKNAIPVLITPVARVKFSGSQIIGGAGLHGENFAYVEAVRQLASEEKCLLIDLFADSKEMLETATSTYANYLMALKPNDLVGAWPVDYDATYGNTSKGYTGIEATHYNKYGAFLQAAKIAEHIINYDNVTTLTNEIYTFKDNVLTTPSTYVDPSNLISKSYVSQIEALFEVNVTNPNRTYKQASEVVTLINQLSNKGAVTSENYLELKEIVENIRNEYYLLNVDDRSGVTNLSTLEQYEEDIEEQEAAARPKPISTEVYDFNDEAIRSFETTEVVAGLNAVAGTGKAMEVKSAQATFTHNGVEYSVSKAISLGGSAKFGQNRYIELEVAKACQVTIVAKSSGSSDRTLDIRNSSNTSVGTADAKASVSITTIDIENAGIYMIGSTGSGIYVYAIIVEYFE